MNQLGPVMAECGSDATCTTAAFEDFKKKALSPTMTLDKFKAEVQTAAAKGGLQIAKGCDGSDKDNNCADVIFAAYKKASGMSGDDFKKSDAVTAVKEALPEEIAQASTSCIKTPKECRTLMMKKIKESKVFIDPNLLVANVSMRKYKS